MNELYNKNDSSDSSDSDKDVIKTTPRGKRGRSGKTILSGYYPPSKYLGKSGDFYIDINTSTIYGPKCRHRWPTGVSLSGSQGIKGDSGTSINVGTDPPVDGTTQINGAPPVSGDVYIDALGDVYQYNGSTWGTFIFNIKGPAGNNGINGSKGSSIYAGTDFSVDADPANGDLFINTNTGEVYLYNSNNSSTPPNYGWGDTNYNITGPEGPPGTSLGIGYIPPVNGPSPTEINNAPPIPGDVYINLVDGEVYTFDTISGWSDTTYSIKGTQGNSGSPGGPGSTGPQGNRGSSIYIGMLESYTDVDPYPVDGDLFIDLTDSDIGEVYIYSSDPGPNYGWTDTSYNIQGPQGAQGIQGPPGPSLAVGELSPPASGSVLIDGSGPNTGDIYIQLNDGEVWEYVQGSWKDTHYSIKGATGATGATGGTGPAGGTVQVIPYSSGGIPAIVTTSSNNGIAILGTFTILGFGTSITGFAITAPNSINIIDFSGINTEYIVPVAGTIKQLISSFITTMDVLLSVAVTINVYIYISTASNTNPTTYTLKYTGQIGILPSNASTPLASGAELTSSLVLSTPVGVGDRIIIAVGALSVVLNAIITGNATATIVIS